MDQKCSHERFQGIWQLMHTAWPSQPQVPSTSILFLCVWDFPSIICWPWTPAARHLKFRSSKISLSLHYPPRYICIIKVLCLKLAKITSWTQDPRLIQEGMKEVFQINKSLPSVDVSWNLCTDLSNSVFVWFIQAQKVWVKKCLKR